MDASKLFSRSAIVLGLLATTILSIAFAVVGGLAFGTMLKVYEDFRSAYSGASMNEAFLDYFWWVALGLLSLLFLFLLVTVPSRIGKWFGIREISALTFLCIQVITVPLAYLPIWIQSESSSGLAIFYVLTTFFFIALTPIAVAIVGVKEADPVVDRFTALELVGVTIGILAAIVLAAIFCAFPLWNWFNQRSVDIAATSCGSFAVGDHLGITIFRGELAETENAHTDEHERKLQVLASGLHLRLGVSGVAKPGTMEAEESYSVKSLVCWISTKVVDLVLPNSLTTILRQLRLARSSEEHRPFAESVGDGFRSAALFTEEPL